MAAEQGEATSQYNLGVMYAAGEGVPKDDVEAAKWFREAAEQGDANAQSSLGVMYTNGEGVPEDFIEAYAWANIAAAQGNEMADSLRESLREEMDGDSIAKAQELSRDYFEEYVAPFQ